MPFVKMLFFMPDVRRRPLQCLPGGYRDRPFSISFSNRLAALSMSRI